MSFDDFESFLNGGECSDVGGGCSHSDAVVSNEDGTSVCCWCGQVSRRHEVQHRPKRSADRKLHIDHLNLTPDIESKVHQYFAATVADRVYRCKIRKGIICACIYYAYKRCGVPQNYADILKWFGITRREASPGLQLLMMAVPEIRS